MNTIQKSLISMAIVAAFAAYIGSIILQEIKTADLNALAYNASTYSQMFIGPQHPVTTGPQAQKIIKQPSFLTASTSFSNGHSVVNLAWKDNADNENGFWVVRSKNSYGEGASTMAKLPANTEKYTDTEVLEGQTWWYRVRVTAASATSSNRVVPGNVWSNWTHVMVPLNAPTEAKAFRDSNSTNTKPVIELTWKDNSSKETGYRVYRFNGANTSEKIVASTMANWIKVADLPANTTNWHDTKPRFPFHQYMICASRGGVDNPKSCTNKWVTNKEPAFTDED